MRKIIASFTAVLMLTSSVFAQSGFKSLKSENNNARAERVMPLPPRPIPVPRIEVSPNRQAITLQDLKVDIEVVGNLAMTTYEMVFHNPNHVIMEGEFILPLSENQNVSAIALDINGKMRDGVVVEKQKARETFESIVRRGVDPALVEKTSGNQFKTRIYPFNPNNTRRIRVTIEEPLNSKDDNYVYSIPLQFNENINFELNAEIPADSVASIPKTDTDLSKFVFTKEGKYYKASFSQKNYLLNNTVAFALPKLKTEPVFTHTDGKNTYFYSDINIKPSSQEKTLPKKIALIWDSSFSASKRDIAREEALLDAYFKKLSNVEVNFITFNIKSDIKKNFSVKNGNWDALKKEIGNLIYDGATRFDEIKFSDLKTDEILLFTDGVSTFGNTRIDIAGVPVFVVNSSSEFNRGGLVNASVKSGGSFINLNAITDKEALTLLTKQNLKLISYSYDDKKVNELYPQPGAGVGENFTFAGILTAPESEITLSFGYDKKNITQTKKIKIKSGADNQAVARLWAVQKIKDLEMDSDKNEKEILKLGQRYSVVTDFTSLLVLEEVRDYVTYKITPPQELLAEYNRLIANARKSEEQKEENALNDAIAQAKEIKDWWNKDFDQSKPPQPYKKLKGSSGDDDVVLEEETSVSGSLREDRYLSAQEIQPAAPMASPGPDRRQRTAKSAPARNMSVAAVAQSDSVEMMDYATSMSGGTESKDSSAKIQVKAWDPQTPYMKILKKSKDDELYQDYLKLKSGYDDQPSFFFDITDEFIRRNMKNKAVVILSNIAEMKLDNVELLRTVANKLMELEEYQYAVDMFEKILKLRGEDPQSYRDLALAYQANKAYQKALDAFYKVLTGSWGRFNSVKQIVFVEMNNLISMSPKIDTSKINKELIFAIPVDIRVVLSWSTDNTDIDLHIKDPYENHTYYGDRFSRVGGRLSVDLTQGFGPEEFMLKKAVDGSYEIFTNNFGDRRQSVSGPTVLYLDIYTFYGTKKQTHQRVLVRTENVKQDNVIGNIDFKK